MYEVVVPDEEIIYVDNDEPPTERILERILAVFNPRDSPPIFLIKWEGVEEPELILASRANILYTHVLQFYDEYFFGVL